eukprot:13209_1
MNQNDSSDDSDDDINWDSSSQSTNVHENGEELFDTTQQNSISIDISHSIEQERDQPLESKEEKPELPIALTKSDHLKAMEQIYSLLHHFNIQSSFELIYDIIASCLISNERTASHTKRRICSHCCLYESGQVQQFVAEWGTESNCHTCCNNTKFSIYPEKKSKLCLLNETKQDYTGIFHPRCHIVDPCTNKPMNGCCLQFVTKNFQRLQINLKSQLQHHKILYNVNCKNILLSYITDTYTISGQNQQLLSRYFQKQYQQSNRANNSSQLSPSQSPSIESHSIGSISLSPSPPPPTQINSKRKRNMANLNNSEPVHKRQRVDLLGLHDSDSDQFEQYLTDPSKNIHRKILFDLIHDRSFISGCRLWQDINRFASGSIQVCMDNMNALKELACTALLKIIVDDFDESTKKYGLTVTGEILATKINTLWAVSELSDRRINFITKLDATVHELRETETDGNCLFRSMSNIIFGHQNNHHILRQLCTGFEKSNKILFGNKFNALRAQEDNAEYITPIESFDIWLSLNERDRHYDEYSELHYIAFGFIFSALVVVVDGSNRMYYPQEAASEHYVACKHILDSIDPYNHVRLVNYSSHFEPIHHLKSPLDLLRCKRESGVVAALETVYLSKYNENKPIIPIQLDSTIFPALSEHKNNTESVSTNNDGSNGINNMQSCLIMDNIELESSANINNNTWQCSECSFWTSLSLCPICTDSDPILPTQSNNSVSNSSEHKNNEAVSSNNIQSVAINNAQSPTNSMDSHSPSSINMLTINNVAATSNTWQCDQCFYQTTESLCPICQNPHPISERQSPNYSVSPQQSINENTQDVSSDIMSANYSSDDNHLNDTSSNDNDTINEDNYSVPSQHANINDTTEHDAGTSLRQLKPANLYTTKFAKNQFKSACNNKILTKQQFTEIAVKSNGLLPKDAQRIYEKHCKPKIVDNRLNIDLSCEKPSLDDNLTVLKGCFKQYSENSCDNADRLKRSIRWFW